MADRCGRSLLRVEMPSRRTIVGGLRKRRQKREADSIAANLSAVISRPRIIDNSRLADVANTAPVRPETIDASADGEFDAGPRVAVLSLLRRPS